MDGKNRILGKIVSVALVAMLSTNLSLQTTVATHAMQLTVSQEKLIP